MIWTEEKYAPCLDALEAAGLTKWKSGTVMQGLGSDNDGWLLYDLGQQDGGWVSAIDDNVAGAIIERAARVWLEKRDVDICREVEIIDDGDQLYRRYHYIAWRRGVDGESGTMIADADSYTECEAKAILAMCEETT